MQGSIGLVLSGGGARAIAHLGVLRALEERDLRPKALAGASAGALIAALYAAGLSPESIKDIFHDTAYFGLSHLLLGGPGIFNMDGMRTTLQDHLPCKTFEDLPIPLFVTATNLTEGRTETISSGPLIDALLASACVPVVFEPVFFKGAEWVDGGLLDNFPVEALTPHCNYIIGSHVNRLNPHMPPAHSLHKAHILERCFHLSIAAGVYEKAAHCDIFLDHPDLADFGMFDTKKANRLFRLGYEYSCRVIPPTIQPAISSTL